MKRISKKSLSYKILELLKKESKGLTLDELAKIFKKEKRYITAYLSRLMKKGLVDFYFDKSRNRKVYIITKEGIEMLKKLE